MRYAEIRHGAVHTNRAQLPREALASITVAAAGRTDLLAHAAGILLGFHEGTTGEARARHTADLLIKAGADQHQIPRWTEGRRRAHPGVPGDRP
jgi:hypothetical protein